MSNETPPNNNRAKPTDNAAKDQKTKTPSLASRIGSSASALSRDLVSGASSSTSTLASSLAASEKAQQAAGGPSGSSLAGPSTWAENRRPGASGLSRGSGGAAASSSSQQQQQFRSAPAGSASGEQEWKAWEQPAGQGTWPPPNLDYRASLWTGQFRTETEDLRYTTSSRSKDVSAAQKADGTGVVDLLQDPKLLGDASVLESEMQATKQVPAKAMPRRQLTASELEMRAKVKAVLPPPPKHLKSQKKLNLEKHIEMLKPTPGEVRRLKLAAHSRVEHTLSEEEWDAWVKHFIAGWSATLYSYTDEVWGEDLPWVDQAKKEIEVMMKMDDAELDDRQSVRRLQMILRHVKVPGADGSAPSRPNELHNTSSTPANE